MKAKEKNKKEGEKVLYSESILLDVFKSIAKFSEGKGYALGNFDGSIIEPRVSSGVMSILEPRPSEKKIWKIEKKQKAINMGRLWFNSRGAEESKKWIIEVFGRENIEKMEELARELFGEYSIPISIVLKRETLKMETRLDDGML